MIETIVVFFIIGLIITGILVNPVLIKWRRSRLKQRPFPSFWHAIIETNLPIYSCLSPAERRRLQGHIQVFLAEKQFIACGELLIM